MKHKSVIDFEEPEISVQDLFREYYDTNMTPLARIGVDSATGNIVVSWDGGDD